MLILFPPPPLLCCSNCSLRRCSSFRNRFRSFTISSLISFSICEIPLCSALNCETQMRFEKRFASARELRSLMKSRMSPSPRSWTAYQYSSHSEPLCIDITQQSVDAHLRE